MGRELDPGEAGGAVVRALGLSLALGLFACGPPPLDHSAQLRCDGADAGAPPLLAEVFGSIHAPSCARCHNPSGQAPAMDTEGELRALVGAESLNYAPLRSIAPGAPAASVMYLKILGGRAEGITGPNGESVGGRMPPATGELTDAQKDLMRRWICAGAP